MTRILNRYLLGEQLGSGVFGSVYKAERRSDARPVAIKLSKTKEKTFEIEMLDELRHPNIITAVESKQYRYKDQDLQDMVYFDVIVMDWMPMDLEEYQRKQLRTHEIRTIVWQVLTAVRFMHGKRIAHCDLKPKNILVEPRTMQVKICDLGLTCRLRANDAKPIGVQTRGFVAPEVLLDYPFYTKTIDLWSVGCIAAGLSLGRQLFGGASDAKELHAIYKLCGPFSLAVRNRMLGKMPALKFPKSNSCKRCLRNKLVDCNVDERAVELIDRLLRMDPHKRISAYQALNLRYFRAVVPNTN